MILGPNFVLVLFIALMVEPTQSAFSYIAQCNYDANGFFTTVEVWKGSSDTIFNIPALSSSNAVVSDCFIPQVGTSDEYKTTIEVDSTGSTFTPAACGGAISVVDTNGDGDNDEVIFKFLIQSTEGYVFGTDVIFTWKCTTADPNNVLVETFTISSLPANDLSLSSQFALEVYDATDDTKKLSGSELTLGGSYYLKLKHTYSNSQNRQVGIFVYRLVFYEGGVSSTAPHVLAIVEGCKRTVPAYGLTQNFVKEVGSSNPPSAGANGVYVIKSGTFETALWVKTTGISTNLNIEAVILTCLSSDQSPCDDYQSNVCDAIQRRRRSNEETGLQNMTSVATRFTISLSEGNDNQGSGKSDAKETMETCYQAYTFWILILVLGILMLLCLIFAVFLYFRLRREKESRRKTEEKYGIINPVL